MADLDRIFWIISLRVGVKGFLDNILNKLDSLSFKNKYLDGFFFKFEYKLKKFFTILSSSEWKLTIINIPPSSNISVAAISPWTNSVNSWFMKILIAWNVWVEGFFLKLPCFFFTLLIIEASSSDVFIVFFSLEKYNY